MTANKTTAEVLGKVREILQYCSHGPGELHHQNQAQFMRAREGLALLDTVQAGEVSDQTKAALKAVNDISRYVGILTASGTLQSEHSRVIASSVKDARFAIMGILPKEQPKPDVVTEEQIEIKIWSAWYDMRGLVVTDGDRAKSVIRALKESGVLLVGDGNE